jgi:mono/diheme cytochrome c family protein
MGRLRFTLVGLTLGVAVAVTAMSGSQASAEASLQERGKYLLYAGGCISCHTDKATLKAKGPILGGGRALKTPFGTFYGPNITPHPEHGIGRWTEAQFRRALRHGRAPSGRNYYPSFPYTTFTRMTDSDIGALWAYLRTIKPVDRRNRPHAIGFPYNIRFLVTFWKWLNFKRGPFRPDPAKPKAWNRGAYLVTALAHCGECHTPRNAMGGLRRDLAMSGTASGPVGDTPNITPDKKTGIGSWSASDVASALKLGMLPDGDIVGGEMIQVVEHGTSHLSERDLNAIAAYLRSLPALRSKPKKKTKALPGGN